MRTFIKFQHLLVLGFILVNQILSAQDYPKSSKPQTTSNPGTNSIGSPLQPIDVPQSGCGAIWNHLVHWRSETTMEVAASIVEFAWYAAPPKDDGISVIIDPIFSNIDKGTVILTDSVRIDRLAVEANRPDIKFSLGDPKEKTPDPDGIAKALKNTKFNIDAKTNKATIKQSKGLSVATIQFFDAKRKGEMWGRCRYKQKTYYVKMNWEMGKLDGEEFSGIN